MTLAAIILEVSMYLLVLSLRVCSLVVIANKKFGASGEQQSGGKSKSIVCHSCEVSGRIRPNCPNWVNCVH